MKQRQQVRAQRHLRRARAVEEAHPAVAGIELAARGVEVPLGEVAAVERELEALLRLHELALRVALLGDVAADAAVAGEMPIVVVARLAGDDMHLARAALVAARHLQVEERLLGREALEVRGEHARLDLDSRNLPEALAERRGAAEERGDRPAAGEPDDAVVGIGFPEPVGRQAGERAEALGALLELPLLAQVLAEGEQHHAVDGRPGQDGEQEGVDHGGRALSRRRAPAAPP
jgi:hypothetical protein